MHFAYAPELPKHPSEAYRPEFPAEEQDYAHADIVRELRMAKSRHTATPLFEGRWQ